MPTGRENEYFRALPRNVKEAAARRMLGRFASPDAIARVIDNAAINPTVAQGLMVRVEENQRDASIRNVPPDPPASEGVEDQGDPGRGSGGHRLPPGSDGAGTVQAPAAADDGGGGSALLYGLGGAAAGAAATYALGRRRGRDVGGGAGVDPDTPTSTVPDPVPDGPRSGVTANDPAFGAENVTRHVFEGEFQAGDRMRVPATTPSRAGVTLEGQVVQDPLTGEFFLRGPNGEMLPYDTRMPLPGPPDTPRLPVQPQNPIRPALSGGAARPMNILRHLR